MVTQELRFIWNTDIVATMYTAGNHGLRSINLGIFKLYRQSLEGDGWGLGWG